MREKHYYFVVNHLLRSFIGKHGSVKSSTVARWIKTYLQKAGIDTSKFQAHSVNFNSSNFWIDSRGYSTGSQLVQWKCLSEVLLSNKVLRRVRSKSFGGWVTCWYRDWAFRSIIVECLRSCDGHQLFVIIRGGWGWNINMSHPPLPLCTLFFSHVAVKKSRSRQLLVCIYRGGTRV